MAHGPGRWRAAGRRPLARETVRQQHAPTYSSDARRRRGCMMSRTRLPAASLSIQARASAHSACAGALARMPFKRARAKRGQRAVAIRRARRQDRRCSGREAEKEPCAPAARARTRPSQSLLCTVCPSPAAAPVMSPSAGMPFSVRCSGALDEVDVETLRPRRLRPDAVACPRRARHRVGASPA